MSSRRGYAPELLVAVLVALAMWHSATASGAPIDDPIALERDHFGKGVALAHQEKFDQALREFEAAYQIKHNFWVLYNLAQAHVALAHTDDAIQILGKYLSDGRGQLPRKRIQEVTRQLDELAGDLQLAGDGPGSPGDATATQPATGPAAGPQSSPALPMAQTSAPRMQPLPGPPGQTFPPTDDAPRSIRVTRTNPWVMRALAIGGGALAGAAIGVYVWNRGRFEDWSTTDSTLRQSQMPGYEALQIANNRRAASISQVSTLDGGLALAASALLATDVIIWLANRRFSRDGAASPVVSPAAALNVEWRAGSGGSVTWKARW